MEFQIPPPLKSEHEELHAELTEIIRAGGQIGEAAQAVAEALHPHFVKEEEYALPPKKRSGPPYGFFFERVFGEYLALASRTPKPILVLAGSGGGRSSGRIFW